MTDFPETSKDCEQTEIGERLPRSFMERVCDFLERYANDAMPDDRLKSHEG